MFRVKNIVTNIPIGSQCETGQEIDSDSAQELHKLFERPYKFSDGNKIISYLIRQPKCLGDGTMIHPTDEEFEQYQESLKKEVEERKKIEETEEKKVAVDVSVETEPQTQIEEKRIHHQQKKPTQQKQQKKKTKKQKQKLQQPNQQQQQQQLPNKTKIPPLIPVTGILPNQAQKFINNRGGRKRGRGRGRGRRGGNNFNNLRGQGGTAHVYSTSRNVPPKRVLKRKINPHVQHNIHGPQLPVLPHPSQMGTGEEQICPLPWI